MKKISAAAASRKDFAAFQRGDTVEIVLRQTIAGMYDSMPAENDIAALAAAMLTGGHVAQAAAEDLLRPYSDRGHGEGLDNLWACAIARALGLRYSTVVEYR